MLCSIKSLSHQTAEDYYRFFENCIFAHDKHTACYCTAWNMTAEAYVRQVEEPVKSGQSSMREAGRKAAQQLIESGQLQGYLAYVEGEPIGWCNANDKTAYAHFGVCSVEPPACYGLTKSVVCFEVAPSFRNLGVASALLKHICEESLKQGYRYVEAYPCSRNVLLRENYDHLCHMYEKLGFTVLCEVEDGYIMRKSL